MQDQTKGLVTEPGSEVRKVPRREVLLAWFCAGEGLHLH